jgi:hypothetical protein
MNMVPRSPEAAPVAEQADDDDDANAFITRLLAVRGIAVAMVGEDSWDALGG